MHSAYRCRSAAPHRTALLICPATSTLESWPIWLRCYSRSVCTIAMPYARWLSIRAQLSRFPAAFPVYSWRWHLWNVATHSSLVARDNLNLARVSHACHRSSKGFDFPSAIYCVDCSVNVICCRVKILFYFEKSRLLQMHLQRWRKKRQILPSERQCISWRSYLW